ncbi:hypothetical protein GCM10023113_18500 [Cellulomonas oligotrophica]|uniref:Uncharacterized protein n=1 Tax=Cellulomonas oligotrophica TaxID=931536 RepID=A0ABQ4DC45_9CELL|nr:hypothetical protein Col01nite_24650 [Cellulomonas oligotrophica]
MYRYGETFTSQRDRVWLNPTRRGAREGSCAGRRMRGGLVDVAMAGVLRKGWGADAGGAGPVAVATDPAPCCGWSGQPRPSTTPTTVSHWAAGSAPLTSTSVSALPIACWIVK